MRLAARKPIGADDGVERIGQAERLDHHLRVGERRIGDKAGGHAPGPRPRQQRGSTRCRRDTIGRGDRAERSLLGVGQSRALVRSGSRKEERHDVLVRATRHVTDKRRFVELAAGRGQQRIERRQVNVFGLRERAVQVEQQAGAPGRRPVAGVARRAVFAGGGARRAAGPLPLRHLSAAVVSLAILSSAAAGAISPRIMALITSRWARQICTVGPG